MGLLVVVVIVVICVVFDYFDEDLEVDLLECFVNWVEMIVYLNLSGLDVKICFSENIIKFICNIGFLIVFMYLNVYLVIVDIGIYGYIKEVVDKVKLFGEVVLFFLKELGYLVEVLEDVIYKSDFK